MNVDAAVVPGNNFPSTLPTSSYSQIITEISGNLPSDDLKKLYFLCLDIISSGHQPPQNIIELLDLVSNEIDSVLLLKELLYHIKKYRLLKSLHTCKHQMEELLRDRKYVRQERLSLFHVCENLESNAVKQLKLILCGNSTVTEGWEAVEAEDFFRTWLREVDNNKMLRLKQALLKMKRAELAESLITYGEPFYNIITPAKRKPCGLAVIFNNEHFHIPRSKVNEVKCCGLSRREGTRVDEEKLCNLWTKFGFDVAVFNDKTYSSMMDILERLTKLDYSNYSVFACFILTHGDKGVIFTSDSCRVDYHDIIYKFSSSHVPSLCNKPKMFFIQACQGKAVQIVQLSPETPTLQTDSVGYTSGSSNDKRDMLWVLSAIPSHMSFRDVVNGSWFISSLVEIVGKEGTQQSIRKLIDLVAEDVSAKTGSFSNMGYVTQMPAVTVTTFRELRLKKLDNKVELSQIKVKSPNECSAVLLNIYHLANAIYRV